MRKQIYELGGCKKMKAYQGLQQVEIDGDCEEHGKKPFPPDKLRRKNIRKSKTS